MRQRAVSRLGGASLAMALVGCTSYHPVPLPSAPKLAPRLGDLNLRIPARDAPGGSVFLNAHGALRPQQVALLAAMNNPELAYERAKVVTAQAAMRAGRALPNPSLGLSYASLISGPATSGAITASISQDIQSLITYKARAEAARDSFGQVSAKVLWREWQVARRAQLLAGSIYFDDREVAIRRKNEQFLSSQLAAIEKASGAGNADLAAVAPIEAARANAQKSLAAARLARLKHWIALDRLLGLDPSVRFAIAPPPASQIPREITSLISTLPQRRPDLVALQLGYSASAAKVRASILTQFPPLTFGIAGGSDTSKVVSAGPQITVDLPVFHGAGPQVALQRATRTEMRKQYRARLDTAVSEVLGLKQQFEFSLKQISAARNASKLAGERLAFAEKAYNVQEVDQRTLVDFATSSVERKIDVVTYERSLYETAVSLATDLGSNLPVVELSASTARTEP